jgi:hypothetical protein
MIPGLNLSPSRTGAPGGTAKPLGASAAAQAYPTNNLKRLLQMLSGLPKPHVLDLGRLSGPNIQWLIQKGYKVYVDDRLSTLKPAPLPPPPSRSGKSKPPPPPLEPLEYSPGLFDAALCWDLFDYLAPTQARDLIAGLRKALKPKGLVLALFNFNRVSAPPPVRYRILQADQLEYKPLPTPPIPRRVYENREIQEFFSGFDTVNSCFLMNQMREVLVQRLPG